MSTSTEAKRATDDGRLEVDHGVSTRPGDPRQNGVWEPEIVDLAVASFPPRPPSAEVYVPDTVLDAWQTPELTIRLASVRGYAHRYGPAPRQDDAVARYHAASGAVVVAVADGVGSAPRSHHGARTAVREATASVLRSLDVGEPLQWEFVFPRVAAVLERLADRYEAAPTEAAALLGTTLMVALVRPVPGGFEADLAWAGDSGSWVLDEQGCFHPVLESKTADGVTVVSSAVRALPQRPVEWNNCTVSVGPGHVLLLGSDGFGDPLGDGTGLVGELFARTLVSPPPAFRFGHLVDFSRETFDDDRTLVAVWPHGDEKDAGQKAFRAEPTTIPAPGPEVRDGGGEERQSAQRARGPVGAMIDTVLGRHCR